MSRDPSEPIGPGVAVAGGGQHPSPIPVGLDPSVVGIAGYVGDFRQSADGRACWVKRGAGPFEWERFPPVADQPTFEADDIDLTAAGPSVIVPRQAGKSFRIDRLEIESVASSGPDWTTPSALTIGSNASAYDNVVAAGRIGLSSLLPGSVLRLGSFDPVSVDASDLVLQVATAQVGGTSVATVRIWGAYV